MNSKSPFTIPDIKQLTEQDRMDINAHVTLLALESHRLNVSRAFLQYYSLSINDAVPHANSFSPNLPAYARRIKHSARAIEDHAEELEQYSENIRSHWTEVRKIIGNAIDAFNVMQDAHPDRKIDFSDVMMRLHDEVRGLLPDGAGWFDSDDEDSND